jgi:PAS domain S-box-containing protein
MTQSSSCPVLLQPEEVSELEERDPRMYEAFTAIVAAEKRIVEDWVYSEEVEQVLLLHGINPDLFHSDYAHEVFSYFVGVIGGFQQIGDCPIMATFLEYLKNRDVSSDELFIICTHFRKAMLKFLAGTGLDIRYLFGEISYVFDMNFAGVLKMYSGRLHEKELELAKSVKLLNEYKNAIDVSAIVSRTDENGIITYVNDRFVDICGYTREELIGASHNITRHPDTPRDFFSDLWQTIKGRDVFHGTIHNRRKNGESYYMDLTIVPIYDPVKEVTEYMGIGYEITRLVEARQEAELAGQAKEYFLSNMSHEIRTPLNAILGFVSLLLDESESPKHRQYLEIIHNSGENLLSIINDILDFSKLRSGEFTVEHQTFNLHGELSHTLELFAPSANKKKITLFSFIDPAIPYELVADPLRIKQIVSNLLSNAIKFTPYEGCIDILAQIEDGMLKITVQDNGIGISAEDQANIFNAFSQVEHFETRKTGGTGLGLSICKKLAEHMSGSIELESELGKGSCFTLLLPVEQSENSGTQELDTAAFRQLRLGLLSARHKRPEIVALLERYWEIFDYEVADVTEISGAECDLLFFVDSDADEATRREIIDSGKPAVAIMEYISDSYETVDNVTPLYFPIYCTKLHSVMAQALNLFSVAGMEDETAAHRQFRGHLLVAEDNVANQQLVRIILDRYGLDYTITDDGIEAVEAFKEGAFDLVLMDEQMPRMNGIDAMRKIRIFEAEQGFVQTPIVAVTANVVKGVREHGIRAGYDAFLGKPISLEELEEVFERHLQEVAPADAAPEPSSPSEEQRIEGLDMEKLRSELMLEHDDIIMLLEVFLKKVQTLRGELAHAINANAYATIAKIAHSIKGSSANFRMEEVQQLAREVEEAATAKKQGYDYQGMYEKLFSELEKVKIIEA